METKDHSTEKESSTDQELKDRLEQARETRRPARHPDATRIEPTEVPDVEAIEEPETVAAMKAAASGELKATDVEQQEDALHYLLAAFHDDEEQEVTKTLRINVGSSVAPRQIRWKIRSIPGPTIRSIRETAEEAVRRRRGGMQTGAGATNAAFQANVRVVIEGTVEPNIKEGARQVGLADPADFLETALNRKQLLIDQIAGEILTLSGGDEEDVQDDLEVQAAGNSSS